MLRGADLFSVRLTAFIQRGSIPATQSVILSTLVLVPVIVLALGARDRPDFALWDSPLQVVVGLVILAAALGATVMHNRLAAVLLVGVTGYGCGTIFAFHGAPDLALTQFLVETLTLVIFVLVLRTLPAETDSVNIRRYRLPRAALALAVGATVTTLAVYAMAARTGTPIAELLPDAAYFRGHGANAVNVLLVDIRAWDTMGEISVLLVAATGVASLVFRHRRFGAAPRVADAGRPDTDQTSAFTDHSPAVGDVTWLRGSELRDPRHRSLVLEVATRMIFPLIMVLSAYFFFAGHNTPGGGFAGGLTAGLALVLRYLAGGRYELGETLPLDAGKILGVGLGLSAGTAAASLLVGAPVLSSALIQVDVPVLGTVKFVTALFFDLGVYLIVVGLVLDVLRSLGARVDVEMGEQQSKVATRMTDLPRSPGAHRRFDQRGRLSSAGTQHDPNVAGAVADRQRDQPVDLDGRRPFRQSAGARPHQQRRDHHRRSVGAGHDPDGDRHHHGHRGVRAGAGLPVLPADHRGGSHATTPRTPGSRSYPQGSRPRSTRTVRTPSPHATPTLPDELDALPGLEGSR